MEIKEIDYNNARAFIAEFKELNKKSLDTFIFDWMDAYAKSMLVFTNKDKQMDKNWMINNFKYHKGFNKLNYIINCEGVYNVKIYSKNNNLYIEELPYGEYEIFVKIDKNGFIKTKYSHEKKYSAVSTSTISTILTIVEDNEKFIDAFLGIG